MNIIRRYLNKFTTNSNSCNLFKKFNTNSFEKMFSKFSIRSFAENKPSQANSDKSEPDQQDKKTKHIYKKKEQNITNNENSDVIRKETHFFREGFNNGIHVREEVSYVCYELPTEGKSAESKGKSENNQGKSEDNKIKSEDNKEKSEDNKGKSEDNKGEVNSRTEQSSKDKN